MFANRETEITRGTVEVHVDVHLHSAKGLEFDAVIMYGVDNRDFPNMRDIEAEAGLCEAANRPRTEVFLYFRSTIIFWVQELYERSRHE